MPVLKWNTTICDDFSSRVPIKKVCIIYGGNPHMYTGHASINNGYAVLSTGITNIKNISRSVTTFVNIQIGTKFCCLYLYWYTPYI